MVAALLAIMAGGLLLIWPAFLNGYPLLFSDSGAYLAQTVVPLMIWDKPWIYGPFAWVFHQHLSLWGTVVAQGLIVAHLVWLLAHILGHAAPSRHLALCAALALFTTAPWSAALLMPDILTPVAVLCAALLGWGWPMLTRAERLWLLALGSIATAAHLSNLPVIVALLVLGACLRAGWRACLRIAAPLLGAVGLLLVTNLAGHGRLALSPYGSTFLLARLIADGPAARTIATRCPEAGWYLCAFAGHLPNDSDAFLWQPDSPVNRAPDGRAIFLGGAVLAPEASVIIGETLRREPWPVLQAGFGNFLRQMGMTRIGDTLANKHLAAVVRPRLVERFPAFEVAAHDAALQTTDRLSARATQVAWLHPLVLLIATPILLLAWMRAHAARDSLALGLLLCMLVGVTGNALATGALSGPYDRYQARIAWLLPLAAMLMWERLKMGAALRGLLGFRSPNA
ncbi:hypothetical protein [Sediminicoccus sp. KRV36]|uniref:hypothetical protein n=1 Tax=Sediminicoccus sp. KRV36 TaxID=3133721 RepID=UPI00200F95F5|nr:hypothetical protein [Sediminicoccus rosea]UPY35119.1 hypothetical protein LHU95_12850 [Sediminicoccus rosea]